jgi:dTDP-4-dehydrorhamnose 3,5-epimerase
MKFRNGYIEGVRVDKLVKHADSRGFLVETYRTDTLPEGLLPKMSYVSYTEPGVARGPHEHISQTDIFVFMGPGDFRVQLWDNRKNGQSFANTMTILGGESNPVLVIVPPGIVHGYRNISKAMKGMVLNYPDRLFRGWGKKEEVDEVRHEDKGDEFYSDFMRGFD